jgi:hypothetical protein
LGDLGGFLQYLLKWYVVEQSECDKKAKERFRYVAGGYEFERDYEAFQLELEIWSIEDVE